MSFRISPPTDRLAELNRLIADMPPDNRGRGRPPGPAKTPRGAKRSARLKAAAEHMRRKYGKGAK